MESTSLTADEDLTPERVEGLIDSGVKLELEQGSGSREQVKIEDQTRTIKKDFYTIAPGIYPTG